MKKIYYFILIGSILTTGMYAQVLELELDAAMDATIYSEDTMSNGVGEYFMVGTNNKGFKRRTLLKFDVNSAVPEGAIVESASLTLVPSKVNVAGTNVDLHFVTVAWGEGPAPADGRGNGLGTTPTEGDATWSHTMVGGDAWTTEGGDFMEAVSASTSVTLGEDAIFMSTTLAEDINSWLASPEDNHGWILVGNESDNKSTIRFNSRENTTVESRPTLKLFYTEGSTSTVLSEAINNEIFVYQGNGPGELVIGANSLIGESRFEVYSITGTLVYSGEINLYKGETRIDTGIDKSGIYAYRVISAATMQSGKILVRDQ